MLFNYDEVSEVDDTPTKQNKHGPAKPQDYLEEAVLEMEEQYAWIINFRYGDYVPRTMRKLRRSSHFKLLTDIAELLRQNDKSPRLYIVYWFDTWYDSNLVRKRYNHETGEKEDASHVSGVGYPSWSNILRDKKNKLEAYLLIDKYKNRMPIPDIDEPFWRNCWHVCILNECEVVGITEDDYWMDAYNLLKVTAWDLDWACEELGKRRALLLKTHGMTPEQYREEREEEFAANRTAKMVPLSPDLDPELVVFPPGYTHDQTGLDKLCADRKNLFRELPPTEEDTFRINYIEDAHKRGVDVDTPYFQQQMKQAVWEEFNVF